MHRAGIVALLALVLIMTACEEGEGGDGGGQGPVMGTPVAENPIKVPQPPALTAAQLADLEATVTLALGDSTVPNSPGHFWSQTVEGYRDPSGPRIRYVPGELPNNACAAGMPEAWMWIHNAVYCPADETISYDWSFMQILYGRIGNAAPLAFLAHEWGHHVQHLVGMPDRGKRSELQADCFAGFYLGWLRENNLLADEHLVQVANNFFYVGDDLQGAFFPVWWDPTAHGDGNQRRMAYLVGFDGADFAYCRAYADFAEPAPTRLSEDQILVLAPGVTAVAEQFGTYNTWRVTGEQAEARIVADLDFGTTDASAAMPAALEVLQLNQQPGIQLSAVQGGWLETLGGATGSGASLSYTLPTTSGTVYGVVLTHITADGKGMTWNLGTTVSGWEYALLHVLNAGYCERNAPLVGACPAPLP